MNRTDKPTELASGRALFPAKCSHCHGTDAKGGNAPNLLAGVGRLTDWGFLSTVKWRRTGTAMRAQQLSDTEIRQVHASLRAERHIAAVDPASSKPATDSAINVSAEALDSADKRQADWLAYAGSYSGQRHSALAKAYQGNVQPLQGAWVFQLIPSKKPFAATPIIAGGLMFISEAPDGVVALDARSGRVVWRFNRLIETAKLSLCCGAVNRGIAVLGSRVFVATLDSYLVALDAANGRKLWKAKVAEA